MSMPTFSGIPFLDMLRIPVRRRSRNFSPMYFAFFFDWHVEHLRPSETFESQSRHSNRPSPARMHAFHHACLKSFTRLPSSRVNTKSSDFLPATQRTRH